MAKRFQRDTSASLTTGLVGYWKLNGDATDYYNGRDLGATSASITYVAGKVGKCVSIVTNQYVYDTGSQIAITDNFSVSIWVNLDSVLKKGVFFYNGSSVSEDGWGIGVGNGNFATNGNNLYAYAGDVGYVDFNTLIGTGWHHIIVVRDSGVWKAYLDGVLSATTVSGVTPLSPTSSLFIGHAYPFSGSNFLLDECGVWSKVLTQTEVNDLYNGGNGQTMILQIPSAAGIKRAFIKTASEKWQYLGDIRNGSLEITPEVSNNTVQNNLAVGSYLFEATLQLLQTSVAELEKVDSILDGTNSFLFKLTDAAIIPVDSVTAESWISVSYTQIGVKARFVSGGDSSDNQFIEISIQGSIISSEMDSVVMGTIDDGDFHISTTASETYSNNNGSAGGTLFGYYIDTTPNNVAGIKGNVKPGGFSTVEIKASSESVYETLIRTDTGKMVFDWIAEEDSIKRFIVYNISIDIGYESLITDAPTLIVLDTLNERNTDVRITLFDGKVFTCESNLGIQSQFQNDGDFDKIRRLKFAHKGNILTTAFDGIVA